MPPVIGTRHRCPSTSPRGSISSGTPAATPAGTWPGGCPIHRPAAWRTSPLTTTERAARPTTTWSRTPRRRGARSTRTSASRSRPARATPSPPGFGPIRGPRVPGAVRPGRPDRATGHAMRERRLRAWMELSAQFDVPDDQAYHALKARLLEPTLNVNVDMDDAKLINDTLENASGDAGGDLAGWATRPTERRPRQPHGVPRRNGSQDVLLHGDQYVGGGGLRLPGRRHPALHRSELHVLRLGTGQVQRPGVPGPVRAGHPARGSGPDVRHRGLQVDAAVGRVRRPR